MLRVPSVIPLHLSLEWSHPRTWKTRQITILLGGIPSLHVATSLVLWRATLGQLTRGPPMAHQSQAHLLSALPDLRGNRVLRRHQPVPADLRQHALPQRVLLPSHPSHLCQASHRFTRPPWCVLRNRKPRRLSRWNPKEAPMLSLCPNISQHRFARANRRHRL